MTFLTHHLNLISRFRVTRIPDRLTFAPTNLISYLLTWPILRNCHTTNSISQLCLGAPWAKCAAKMILRDRGTQWLNMFSSLKLGLPHSPPLLIWQVQATDRNLGKTHLGVDTGDKHKLDWILFGSNVPRNPSVSLWHHYQQDRAQPFWRSWV